jgi:uncharacterized protein (TIGR02246 family)
VQLNADNATPDSVRREIEALLAQLAASWAMGDGKAYGELFCEDAQYVEAPGRRVRGKTAIAKSHQRIFDTFFRHTRVASRTPAEIRQIVPDVVLIESSGAVLFPGEDVKDVSPNGLMTMVAKRGEQGWRIISFQNTPTGRFRSLRFIVRYFRSRLRH